MPQPTSLSLSEELLEEEEEEEDDDDAELESCVHIKQVYLFPENLNEWVTKNTLKRSFVIAA